MSIRDEIATTLASVEGAISAPRGGRHDRFAEELLGCFPWMRDEPSEAEVEAAAQSLFAHEGPVYIERVGWLSREESWGTFQGRARSALVAARKVRGE